MGEFNYTALPKGLPNWDEAYNRDMKAIQTSLAGKADKGKPVMFDVVFEDIAVNAATSKFWKNQFGEVSVHIFMTAATGKTIGAAGKPELIGWLPEGFRPPVQVVAAAVTRIGVNRESAAFHFRADGAIMYTGKEVSPNEHVWGSITFIAAN